MTSRWQQIISVSKGRHTEAVKTATYPAALSSCQGCFKEVAAILRIPGVLEEASVPWVGVSGMIENNLAIHRNIPVAEGGLKWLQLSLGTFQGSWNGCSYPWGGSRFFTEARAVELRLMNSQGCIRRLFKSLHYFLRNALLVLGMVPGIFEEVPGVSQEVGCLKLQHMATREAKCWWNWNTN